MEFTAFTLVTGLLTLLLGIGLGRYIWPAVRASDAAAGNISSITSRTYSARLP